jgi:hypothetical protein
MHIIFCNDPIDRKQPDEAYRAEAEAAKALGIPYSLVDYEALVDDGDPERAVGRVEKRDSAETAIYRGWMLTSLKTVPFCAS